MSSVILQIIVVKYMGKVSRNSIRNKHDGLIATHVSSVAASFYAILKRTREIIIKILVHQ